MMTLTEFQQLPPGEAFASGETFQHARLVRWIAVKGWGDDWAVYVGPYYPWARPDPRARGQSVPSRNHPAVGSVRPGRDAAVSIMSPERKAEIEATLSLDRCRRKADQAWDLAGLARTDGDSPDAARWTEEARAWEAQYRVLAQYG